MPAPSPRTVVLALAVVATAGRAAHAQRAHARAPSRAAPSPVISVLHRIETRLRTTRYMHVTRVDEHAGRFDFDCSGMAAWVLSRATPEAHATVMRRNGRGRPVARDYHDAIVAAPADRPRGGWLRVARVADARPGDVIAWRRPPTVASANTGHVAFVLAAPRALDRAGRRYLVRIADATSIPHGDDTRTTPAHSGYGQGTIALILDNTHADPAAYGWYGHATRIDFYTHIAIGRAVH